MKVALSTLGTLQPETLAAYFTLKSALITTISWLFHHDDWSQAQPLETACPWSRPSAILAHLTHLSTLSNNPFQHFHRNHGYRSLGSKVIIILPSMT